MQVFVLCQVIDYEGEYLDSTGGDDGAAPPASPQAAGSGRKPEVDLLDLGSDTPPPAPSPP